MTSLSLSEAYERAQQQAPGISEDDFAEQTRLHLLAGRLVASAYLCTSEEVWLSPSSLDYRAVPVDQRRRDVPAVEWAELELNIEMGSAGAHCWTRRFPREDDRPSEDQEFYSKVRLVDPTGAFKGLWTRRKQAGTDEATESDIAAATRIIEAEIEKEGFISQNKAAEIVRKAHPDFNRDQARQLAKSVTRNQKPGPRGPRKRAK